MSFIFSRWRTRHRVSAKSSRPRTCRACALAGLPLLALLCGCAGVVSPGTSPSGTFQISGSISPQATGNGASVALSGPIAASTTGNGSGNYSFFNLTNGGYAVTPSRTGYIFSPTVQAVSINGADVSGINFTAV